MATSIENKHDYLIIVESPNKAPSYKKYTGIETIASVGHYKGLPKKEMGLDLNLQDPQKAYNPTFVVEEGKEKVYKNIIEKSKQKYVIIATDADREGDAIAFFLYNDVKKNAKGVFRIYVREISSEAINKAISEKIKFEDINKGSYFSFFGRRFSDRLIGYLLSPEATRNLKEENKEVYSIGRVQSPCVRLIKEREDEINEFVPVPFWTLKATLQTKDDTFIIAKHQKTRFDEEEDIDALIKKLNSYKNATIGKIKKTRLQEAPPPPYITSTLQQDASKKLGLGAKESMDAAQELFESEGITYHRTDSYSLSAAYIDTLRDLIEEKYGKKELPRTPNKHVNKNSQNEAHEAIRPSDNKNFNYDKLSSNAKKLYDMIVERTIASQMKPIIFNKTEIIIKIGDEEFKIADKMIEEEGFSLAIPKKNGEMLPKLEENDVLNVINLEKENKFTTPPSRYTGSTFIAELEKREIGRPSTYASIVETIISRGYVELRNQEKKKDKVFWCRQKGHTLIDKYFKNNHTWIVDYNMTKDMEKELDLIAENKLDWKTYLRKVHERLGFIKPKEKEVKAALPDVSCPCCGGVIHDMENFFVCANYKYNKEKKYSTDCQFILWKANKKLEQPISIDDLKNILETGHCGELELNKKLIEDSKSGLKNKNNENFLISPKKYTGLDCPICKKKIVENNKTFSCEDNRLYFDKVWKKSGCDFNLSKENSYFNTIITEEILDKLIKKETLDINGKKMVLDLNNPFFVAEFREINYLDINCPKCSNPLINTASIIKCSTSSSKKLSSGEYENSGCDFKLQKKQKLLGDREMSINDIRKLISGEVIKYTDVGIKLDLEKQWCVSQY